jgi:hypothetical protein
MATHWLFNAHAQMGSRGFSLMPTTAKQRSQWYRSVT